MKNKKKDVDLSYKFVHYSPNDNFKYYVRRIEHNAKGYSTDGALCGSNHKWICYIHIYWDLLVSQFITSDERVKLSLKKISFKENIVRRIASMLNVGEVSFEY